MGNEVILWMGIVVALGLFLTGTPIFVGLGIGSAILSLFAFGLPASNVADMMVSGIASFTMLALPLFVYMGDLFLEGRSAQPMVDTIKLLFSKIRGGVGVATVFAAAFFSAITGSSTAGTATMGMIMIPEMIKLKYDKGFAGAIVASSGTMSNLIPPSLFFILYGVLTEQNIATLFAAGILPGIMTSGVLAGVTYSHAYRKKYPKPPALMTGREKKHLLKKATPALLMPVIVLGSIYGGFATPTESSAIACVYALILGFFVYRGLRGKSLWAATSRSSMTISAVLLMVAAGMVLGKMFVLAGFPEAVKNFVMSANLTPLTFLLLAGVVIVILGTFIECVLMLYVCVPLFYSSVIHLGISPIHFGVVIVLGIMVGQCTPPVAECIYIAASAGNVPSSEIIRHIWGFVVGLALAFLLVIFFPELSLFVPRLLGLPLR
jgi:C4-dicarboxylate transporter DctM subunit